MQGRRPEIIAAREAKEQREQQELDDLKAENARVEANIARIQAETARIQAETARANAQMDALRNLGLCGCAVAAFAGIVGLVAGAAGVIGGGIVGFLPPFLYGCFSGNDAHPNPGANA
ncbi:MAG: hypothetical protein LBB26_04470 [Puniceicoccales bacterium]|jgi:multidrug efflux pump subunit AcrA (membrane-fusion protein)|nr:hypothetical protein [Puniceicoccales bacterium]